MDRRHWVLMVDFIAEPLQGQSARIWAGRQHACAGISPFNGYFTQDRITRLVTWVTMEFRSAHFFIPDVPAAWTLEARGYPPARAAVKARRQGCHLHNKVSRALRQLGISDPEDRILGWERLSASSAYRELHEEAQHRATADAAFQAACRQASRWVLQRDGTGPAPQPHEVDLAVRYLLAELPLFIDSARIIDAPSSMFCYHQVPEFIERLYAGELPWEPVPRQGFLIVTPQVDASTPQPAAARLSTGISRAFP